MDRLKVIAFTHKTISLEELGKFCINDAEMGPRLSAIKNAMGMDELMYITTCNRTEFVFSSAIPLTRPFAEKFFSAFNAAWTSEEIQWVATKAETYTGEEALRHLCMVASSLDSMVVGEREIITQVRKAYDTCAALGLTGDLLRLIIQNVVKTAKEVYTRTRIADRPVSVMSLAYRQLRDLNADPEGKVLVVGAGQTVGTLTKYMVKHGFKNFVLFNRTVRNAGALAKELGTTPRPLSELGQYRDGFDVIVTSTAASEPVITPSLYASLAGNDKSKKIVLDLAIPGDLDPAVQKEFNLHYIGMESLKAKANENLKERQKELALASAVIDENMAEFHRVLRIRKVELAMMDVPKKVKEIRRAAVQSVFAKEIDQLDEQSREVLNKILGYMEKKYISVPMVIAKDILAGKED